jgi:BirA family biotin operon repressor/biotin-[acetyl-CoA-carboxylase] ligase
MPLTFIMDLGEGNVVKAECYKSLPSVVELARTYAKAGRPDRFVVFSEAQTKYSANGELLPENTQERGVYLSIILRPSIFPSQASFLGALSAVSLVTALEEHTSKRLGLGWISDIYCEGKKIGGTATEGMLDKFSSYEYIIVSFAVKLSENDFPPRLTDLVKQVFASENNSIALIIAKNILSKFFVFYPKSLKSPDKMMELYKKQFILEGTPIHYSDNGKRRKAKIISVDTSKGTLIVSAKGGVIKHIASQRGVSIPKKIRIK